MRAEAKEKKGDVVGAMADLERAIEVDPQSVRPYNARGDLKRQEGNLSEALEDHTKAISLDPNNSTAYFYRAYLRYDTQYWTEALADFRKLIGLDDQGDYAAIRIWLIRARLGERSAATEDLTQYFEARKGDKSAEWTGAIAAFLAGRMPAAEFFRRAQDAADPKVKNGQLCEAYFYDATVHLINRDTPNAATLFRKAVATGAKTYTEHRSAVAELKALEYLSVYPKAPTSKTVEHTSLSVQKYDLFISHASEDKDAVARPLYDALTEKGVSVWFDEAELTLGDGLRRKIDEGLALCRYGVVIPSPRFLSKEWPQRELDGLVARETGSGEKAVLPIWHEIDAATLRRYSPTLADKLAVNTREGIPSIVEKIVRAMRDTPSS